MENNQHRDESIILNRETPIQVMLNGMGEDDDTIDLGRVFHTMKLKWRIYAWVLVLCMTVGMCAPLVLYQVTKAPLTVSSVVTLKYNVGNAPVKDLTAPDGEPLDLNQITSSYVLQEAMDNIVLSEPLEIKQVRNNISINRILTEDTLRQQSLVSDMMENKSNNAYEQAGNLQVKYTNSFVVTLQNGFSMDEDQESRRKILIPDQELKQLLDLILIAYNNYLVKTYGKIQLPVDEVSLIDLQDDDLLESLDLMRSAMDNLYDYCDEMPDNIKAYRSWQSGKSLEDWMETLRTLKEVSVDYLYAFVFTNSISRDRQTLVTRYRYQLQDAQTRLDEVNERIEALNEIIKAYKNDEVYVSMQESDAVKSTMTTTDYYNSLILEQPKNYAEASSLETLIENLRDKVENLEQALNKTGGDDIQYDINEVEMELESALSDSMKLYGAIRAHMEEIIDHPIYTEYAEHSAALGKSVNFLKASWKMMLIGMVAGAFIGFGLWFLSGLAPEFSRKKEEDVPVRKNNDGKEAPEA